MSSTSTWSSTTACSTTPTQCWRSRLRHLEHILRWCCYTQQVPPSEFASNTAPPAVTGKFIAASLTKTILVRGVRHTTCSWSNHRTMSFQETAIYMKQPSNNVVSRDSYIYMIIYACFQQWRLWLASQSTRRLKLQFHWREVGIY